MRRGTTPVHVFTFPFDPQQLSKILLTYAQDDENGDIILNKTKDDFTFEGNVGKVILTQEETNNFRMACKYCCSDIPYVRMQIRAKTVEGQVMATDIWRVPLKKVLNDEVL